MALETSPDWPDEAGIAVPDGSLLLERLAEVAAHGELPIEAPAGFSPMTFWPDALALTGRPCAAQLAILEDYDALLDCDGEPIDGGEPITVAEALEVLAGWHRHAARAQSRVRRWAAVIVGRQPPQEVGFLAVDREEVTAAEIALRLGLSPRQAKTLVAEGQAQQGLFAPVAELADAGLLDAAKSAAITSELADTPVEAAVAVMDQVLPDAPSVPAWQLRQRVQRELVRLAPTGEAERARCAHSRRRVNAPRPVGSGMASFSAYLPAVVAAALDQVCESAGRASRVACDRQERSLEQIRADVLATLAEHALVTGQVGAPGITGETFTFDPAHAKVRITTTRAHQRGITGVSVVDTLQPGFGPEDDGGGGGASRGGGSGASPSGSGASPGKSARPTSGGGGRYGASPSDGSRHDGGSDDDGDPGDGDDSRPGRKPRRPPPGGPGRSATAPAHEEGPAADPIGLLPLPACVPGLDVPELQGYGPLAPAMVKALLGLAWVVVTEPATVGPVPPPSTGYRIPAALDRYVRVRDGTCQAPGCDIPAARCDIDHVIAWPSGPTAAWNLRCLCRHHHRLKTHAGHRYRVTRERGVVWTTPAGQILHRAATGRTVSQPFTWRQHHEDPGDDPG